MRGKRCASSSSMSNSILAASAGIVFGIHVTRLKICLRTFACLRHSNFELCLDGGIVRLFYFRSIIINFYLVVPGHGRQRKQIRRKMSKKINPVSSDHNLSRSSPLKRIYQKDFLFFLFI